MSQPATQLQPAASQIATPISNPKLGMTFWSAATITVMTAAVAFDTLTDTTTSDHLYPDAVW